MIRACRFEQGPLRLRHLSRAEIEFIFNMDERRVRDVFVEAFQNVFGDAIHSRDLHIVLFLHLSLVILIEDIRV